MIDPRFYDQIVADSGFDPNVYEFNPQTERIVERTTPRVVEQAQETQAELDKIGAGESFARSFAESIIPTAAGIGAGVLSAPFTGLGAIPIGIAAAMGAGYGQDKLANALDPEGRAEHVERLTQAREEHPWISFAGEVLPGGVVGITQGGLRAAGRSSSGLLKALTRGTRGSITEAEKQAMLSAGLGSGIEVGVEGGQQLLTGDFDLGRLGLAAVTGYTTGGVAPKAKPTTDMVPVEPKVTRPTQHKGPVPPQQDVEVNPNANANETSPREYVIKTGEDAPKMAPRTKEQWMASGLSEAEAEARVKFEAAREPKQVPGQADLGTVGKGEPVSKPDKDQQSDWSFGRKASKLKRVNEARKFASDVLAKVKPKPEKQAGEFASGVLESVKKNVKKPRRYKKELNGDEEIGMTFEEVSKAIDETPSVTKPTTTKAKARLATSKVVSDADALVDPKKALYPATPKKPLKPKPAEQVAEGERLQEQGYKLLEEIKAELNTKQASDETNEIKFQASSNFARQASAILQRNGRNGDYWHESNADIRENLKALAQERGVRMIHELAPLNELGMSDLVNRAISISPEAKLDTGFHEIAHLFNKDALNAGTSTQQSVVRQALSFGHEKARAANQAQREKLGRELTANEELDAEELFTGLVGERAAEVVVNRADKALTSQLKNLFQDFKSGLKEQFGIASFDDLVRLQARAMLDAPVSERMAAELNIPLKKTAKQEFMDEAVDESIRYQKESGITDDELFEGIGGPAENKRPLLDLMKFGLPLFRSSIDNLALKEGRVGQYVGERFVQVAHDKDNLVGVFLNKVISDIDGSGIKGKELEQVAHYMTARYEGGDLPTISDKQRALVDKIQAALTNARKLQNEKGPFIKSSVSDKTDVDAMFPDAVRRDEATSPTKGDYVDYIDADGKQIGRFYKGTNGKPRELYRKGTVEEYYFPISQPKAEVLRVMNNESSGAKYAKLKNDWIEWKMKDGISARDAEQQMYDYLSNSDSVKSARFVGIRTPKGSGLPPSWRETDVRRMLSRYFERYAWDMGFHKNLETDDIARSILRLPNQFGELDYGTHAALPDGTVFNPIPPGNRDVKFIMDTITRNFTDDDLLIDSANRFVKAGMMQSFTGAKDLIVAPYLTASYIPVKQMSSLFRGVVGIPEGIERGLAKGVIQHSTLTNQELSNALGDPRNTMTEFFNGMAEKMYRYSGREFFEKMSRGYVMQVGYLAARDGVTNRNFKMFDELGMKLPDDLIGNPEAVEDFAMEVGAELVRRVQGTYDFRGLPSWAQKGKLSPFFSLAKWNIERANNFTKDVIEPLRKGNFRPLLVATLGGIVGGTALEQFIKIISGRREAWGTWEELEQTDADFTDYAYRLAGLASLSGYGGILSELIKFPGDVKYRNTTQGFDFQLYQASADQILLTKQAGQAIAEGENPFIVLPNYILETLHKHVQTSRLIRDQYDKVANADELAQRNARKDLKIFKILTDRDVSDLSGIEANPFSDSQVREFKRTPDLGRASELAGPITQRAFEEARNPEELAKNLGGLRSLTETTLPNSETNPMLFAEYLDFVSETQGDDAMNVLLGSALERRMKNQIKKSMIPEPPSVQGLGLRE